MRKKPCSLLINQDRVLSPQAPVARLENDAKSTYVPARSRRHRLCQLQDVNGHQSQGKNGSNGGHRSSLGRSSAVVVASSVA